LVNFYCIKEDFITLESSLFVARAESVYFSDSVSIFWTSFWLFMV